MIKAMITEELNYKFCNSEQNAKLLLSPLINVIRILTVKNRPKIKLQRLQKIRIWTFGSLVHQIKSL